MPQVCKVMFRKSTFDDKRAGFELLNVPVLSQKAAPRSRLCSLVCLRDPLCLSYNYCGHICILNSQDAYFESGQLVRNKNCEYSGMMPETEPQCSKWTIHPIEFYLYMLSYGICNIRDKMIAHETVCGSMSNTMRDTFSLLLKISYHSR